VLSERRYGPIGVFGEAQVSYGVPGAAERARLAGQIVLDRLECLGVRPIETRAEVMGVDSLFPGSGPVAARAAAGTVEPYEARVRVAAASAPRKKPRWSSTGRLARPERAVWRQHRRDGHPRDPGRRFVVRARDLISPRVTGKEIRV